MLVTRLRTVLLVAAVAVLGALLGAPSAAVAQDWGPVADGYPRTAAEESGFDRHTRHDEMWEYLQELRSLSTEMRLGSYGETRQGRSLPYAIFSRPLVSEPWEAWTLDRPILVLAANVHGNERTFREGLLVLMRDLATPGTDANDLLDELVVIVAPQINPDGFEASENGQRGNAWGIDLNRDYVKLEHPSIQGYSEHLIGGFRPHVFVDGHNGGSYPYNLNYQCSSAFDPAPYLTDLCDDGIFPAIDALLETEGYRSYFYARGNEEEWSTGGWQARIGRNYGGYANSIGILFEAPTQSLGVGARAGYLGYLAVMDWSAENADQLMSTIRRARVETLEMGQSPNSQVAVQQEYEAEDEPATYDIPSGTPAEMRAALQAGESPEIQTVTNGRLMKKPVATAFRERPYAYLLPRDATDAVAMLRRHDITVERLTEPMTLDVQAYTVAGVTYEQAYNHSAAARVEVGDVRMVTEEFPAGTYMVPTGQMLGRLVTHMLEAETDDNVIYWNTMDAWLPRPGSVEAGEDPLVPIFKVMEPVAIPTLMVDEVR